MEGEKGEIVVVPLQILPEDVAEMIARRLGVGDLVNLSYLRGVSMSLEQFEYSFSAT